MNIQTSPDVKFQLETIIFIFDTKFDQKQYFCIKIEKWAWLLNCVYSNWSKHEISLSNSNFVLLDQICPKMVFLFSSRKSALQYRNLHIQISLNMKFQLLITVLIFETKFPRKQYFCSKTDKWGSLLNCSYSN